VCVKVATKWASTRCLVICRRAVAWRTTTSAVCSLVTTCKQSVYTMKWLTSESSAAEWNSTLHVSHAHNTCSAIWYHYLVSENWCRLALTCVVKSDINLFRYHFLALIRMLFYLVPYSSTKIRSMCREYYCCGLRHWFLSFKGLRLYTSVYWLWLDDQLFYVIVLGTRTLLHTRNFTMAGMVSALHACLLWLFKET